MGQPPLGEAPRSIRGPTQGVAAGLSLDRLLAALLALLLATSACSSAPAPGVDTPPPDPFAPPRLELVPGATAEARIEGGTQHFLTLDLDAGTYLEIRVDQPDEALELLLFEPGVDPEGDKDVAYGSSVRLLRSEGQELWQVATESGRHHLRVDARESSVEYRLEVIAVRRATEIDRSRHEGLEIWAQAEEMVEHGRLEDALERYREAETLFDLGAFDLGVGSALRWEGWLLSSLNQAERAREVYRAAVERGRLAGDLQGEIRSWLSLAALDRNDGDLEEAENHLATARARAAQEENRAAEALVLDHLCRLRRNQGAWQKATQSCLESLRTLEALGREVEAAGPLIGLGQLAGDHGDTEAAKRYYTRALEILERHAESDMAAVIHSDLGILLKTEGHYLEAIRSFQAALDLYERTGATTKSATVLFNMGTSYLEIGEIGRTLDLYQEALERVGADGSLTERIEILGGLAWVWKEMGDLAGAQRDLDEALELSREHGSEVLRAGIFKRRGEIELALDAPEAALASLEVARESYAAANNQWLEAALLRKIAEAHAAMGDLEAARELLAESIEVNGRIGKPAEVADSFYQLAQIERQSGHPDAAHAAILEALDVTERVRDVVGADDLQAFYSATVQPFYELYIDLLMEKHRHEPGAGHAAEALLVAERLKARTLREIIGKGEARFGGDVPSDLLERFTALRADLEEAAIERDRLERQDEPDVSDLFEVRRKIERAFNALREVERRIREASPRYAALTDPEPMAVDRIQRSLLDSETALLEISLGEERSFLWLVTTESFSTYELPGREAIEGQARCVHLLITAYGKVPDPDRLGTDLESCLGPELPPYRDLRVQGFAARGARRRTIDRAFRRAATGLARTLLAGPARDGRLPLRLAIVSDGALEYVPFAALPHPIHPDRGQLLDDHEIVRLPSASVLAVQRQQRAARSEPPAGLVAVVADPVYGLDDPRLPRNRNESTETSTLERDAVQPLQRLEQSRGEARGIVSLVPASRSLVVEGFEATHARVTTGELGEYLYVHFATHGEIDTRYPKLSSLVLSRLDTEGRVVENGSLRLQDIYALELDSVDMVVLSACETALGREIRGEGLMSLTRGFLYAGAERVAATLWQVQDQTTAELMKHFYRNLFEEDLAPAAALRRAQLAVRDAHDGANAFPYYWAGFVLQGEWR